MSDPYWREEANWQAIMVEKTEAQLAALRAVCADKVLPVLQEFAACPCEDKWRPDLDVRCGVCSPCCAATAAEALRKELAK